MSEAQPLTSDVHCATHKNGTAQQKTSVVRTIRAFPIIASTPQRLMRLRNSSIESSEKAVEKPQRCGFASRSSSPRKRRLTRRECCGRSQQTEMNPRESQDRTVGRLERNAINQGTCPKAEQDRRVFCLVPQSGADPEPERDKKSRYHDKTQDAGIVKHTNRQNADPRGAVLPRNLATQIRG